LCGVKALAFAIGLYLPLSTTLPIFVGGALKGFLDWRSERRNERVEEDELSRGSLFATGLIAGGALTGVIVAILMVFFSDKMGALNLEQGITSALGVGGYQVLGVAAFLGMAAYLYRLAVQKD
jgi:hypothetical protein